MMGRLVNQNGGGPHSSDLALSDPAWLTLVLSSPRTPSLIPSHLSSSSTSSNNTFFSSHPILFNSAQCALSHQLELFPTMGQIASRHRPDDPLSPQSSTLSSSQSSTTRIADDSSLSPTHPLPDALPHSSNHNSDLPHQAPLPPKRSSQRKSFLGTLRSPLRNCLNPQRIPSDEPNLERASNTHKRWTLDRRRRKTSKPPRTLLDHPEQVESQLGGPSRPPITSVSSASLSNITTTDQKGKVTEDTPATSATDLPSTVLVGSSSGSSTLDVSPSSSVPLQSTATDLSFPSSSVSPSTSSSLPPRDPLALNHDPAPLPTVSFEPDDTPGSNSDSSEAFNVMERPATPPDPSQPPPLPEARRNFPAAGTLVVVQGVVHTSGISQSGSSEPSDATSRRASSVPPPGERSSRRRLSDLLSRPMRSRRSSYAAPESQPSEIGATLGNDSQDESSPISESSQELSTQDEPPIPASRPLSLSPTSIEVLGTLLRHALSYLFIDVLANQKHVIFLKRRHRRHRRLACFRFFRTPLELWLWPTKLSNCSRIPTVPTSIRI